MAEKKKDFFLIRWGKGIARTFKEVRHVRCIYIPYYDNKYGRRPESSGEEPEEE